MKIKFGKLQFKSSQINKIAFQGGSYSVAMTAIVLAFLIALNVFAQALPSSLTKTDISSSQLYSITSNTKVVVNALEKDVTIYWIVRADEEDEIIENLLSKYESLSEHLTVVKKNPDVFPTFAQQYTSETVYDNSLIVECGEKYRYISLEDIYIGEANYYTGSYDVTDFDGEGAITSAIDYVVSDDFPQIYLLEGHGESELPETLTNQIEKDNMNLSSLSLLSLSEIPVDADALIVYAPQSDLSEEERIILQNYLDDGGNMLVLCGPVEENEMLQWNMLLENYGVQSVEGIVIENDWQYYVAQRPYVLLPDISSHEITDSLIQENYSVVFALSQGLLLDSSSDLVTELLSTSSTSFSKTAGYSLSTYEKEENDIDGPFTTAVSIDTDNEGRLVWFASSEFILDTYNSYSSGANIDLCMNALSSMIEEYESISIRTKSLSYNYLTISESQASLIQGLLIVVFPLAYLGAGIYVVIRNRRKQNETTA